jgi:hypothetical protein
MIKLLIIANTYVNIVRQNLLTNVKNVESHFAPEENLIIIFVKPIETRIIYVKNRILYEYYFVISAHYLEHNIVTIDPFAYDPFNVFQMSG